MRLILAEFDRLRSRRLTLVALILVVLAVAAFQLAVRSQVTPPSAAEIAQGREQYQQVHADWERNHQEYEQQCVEAGESPQDCAYPEPRPEDFVRQPASLAEVGPLSITLSTYLVALAAFVVAGSFIAAEFTTGAIANWLSFVPNRFRVFGSKLIVVIGYAVVVGTLITGLGLATTMVIAEAAGSDLTGSRAVLLQALRSVLIPLALAVVGFCLGVLLRHTAAVMGVLVGYLFVYLARAILSGFIPWVGQTARWSPEGNLTAILDKKYTYFIQRRGPDGAFESLEHSISLTHGLLYWGVLLAVLVALSAAVFRRRDVS